MNRSNIGTFSFLFLGINLWADSSLVPLDTVDLRIVPQTAFTKPEELNFDIIWGGWSFKWVHAGQATLELKPTINPKIWHIRSRAWDNRFFRNFYPVNDTIESFINFKGIYPLRFRKALHEGSYNANIRAEFDQKNHRVSTLDTSLSINPFTHDILSAFYFIRTQNLKVGQSFELAAISGKKKYSLKVNCLREETIQVPAGKFRCLVIEPVLKDDGLFKAKGRLWIWLSQDERRLPIKMQSKIPLGSIKAELIKFK